MNENKYLQHHHSLFLSFLMLIGSVSLAHAEGGPWSLKATYQVPLGKKANLSFGANRPLKRLSIELTGPDSKWNKSWSIAKARKGKKRSFSFSVPAGRSSWTARVRGHAKDETLTSTLNFEVISVGPLKVDIAKSGVTLDKGRITLQTNTPLTKAHLMGFDVQGAQVLKASLELSEKTGDVVLEFDPLKPEAIRRIEVKVFDSVGRWVAFRLVAWYVEIPHDDVIFASNEATVSPHEANKLGAVVKLIQSEVSAFRKTMGRSDVGLDLKLFVAGCTDTVGSEADNLTLSRARAKAIGSYFKKSGVEAPIFYEGYGEKLLAKPTADNVDEPQNRRAIYILTNTQPAGLEQPRRRWRSL